MIFKKSLLSLSIASLLLPSFLATSAPLILDNLIPSQQEIQQSNAWLEINLGQFKQNIEQFKTHIKSDTKICAVMKADAYGNGIRGLMPTIIAQGIPCVAITSNAEARLVRESGFDGQLMRVRSASFDEIKQSLALNIEELIGSESQVEQLAALYQKTGKSIKVHIALNDGGMGRNGIDMSSEAGKLEAVSIATSKGIEVVGIMTHFPNYNAEYIRNKLAEFKQNSAWLMQHASLNRDDILLHVANSYTALNVKEAQLDMVRPGGVFYGDLPTNPEYPSIMSFKTRIASIHHLPEGSTVGYDSAYTVKRASILANLPVGYSDGYPRKMGNRGEVIINGQRAKVAGMTSMNTTMVDVTDIEGVFPGQVVTLFGAQGKERITTAEIEENAALIFPELYTLWGSANPRVYIN